MGRENQQLQDFAAGSMSAVVLTRIDAATNMQRFYKIDVQPTLFGEHALVREWGRIGQPGTVGITLYASVNEAETARDRLRLFKERRGYKA